MTDDYILSLSAEYLVASLRYHSDDLYDLRRLCQPLRLSPEFRADCVRVTAEALRDLGEDIGYMADGTMVLASDD